MHGPDYDHARGLFLRSALFHTWQLVDEEGNKYPLEPFSVIGNTEDSTVSIPPVPIPFRVEAVASEEFDGYTFYEEWKIENIGNFALAESVLEIGQGQLIQIAGHRFWLDWADDDSDD
ncbi:uncharacterized protein [Drosophila virilis]|uniref:Uncharacterized protein, isoform A n=1 Tax=Drosophila virilis TaxID=7244 RepID=B4M3E1_DROVI|nr:uncharacterized protein LOC6631471 [Drosophila virilis]XP_015026630.1 uncharacterized protein LOC6631471 [Drosophila virilis]XP_015026631.1 uncharacterized protein LOC6631471 [Drosophila virilis]EDW65316.1 uncharacterized protein Dvir_GJ19198, isoform A [Drosophila virilis]KRF82179.1 uncharacterized protein Dvir_GJ19198, isoform B [Drosophila virilis]KRF82180.1 uncharacterized protein Dvir_GJ19198, isoform C [Drosophila virilis]